MNTYCDDCKRCTGGNMRKSDVPGGDDHNRCWECESTIQAGMAEADAMISDLRAERDALRERCGKLEAALVEIGNSEDRICGYCEGEGNRYADGKAHYYSEHAPTIPCPECGGRGRIRDMDSEDMAAVANAALATEVKP